MSALPEWDALWALMDPRRIATYERVLDPAPVPWIQTTMHMHDEMLGAVPPISVPGGFLTGEPYTSDPEGRALYAGFRVVGDRVFAKYTNRARWADDLVRLTEQLTALEVAR